MFCRGRVYLSGFRISFQSSISPLSTSFPFTLPNTKMFTGYNVHRLSSSNVITVSPRLLTYSDVRHNVQILSPSNDNSWNSRVSCSFHHTLPTSSPSLPFCKTRSTLANASSNSDSEPFEKPSDAHAGKTSTGKKPKGAETKGKRILRKKVEISTPEAEHEKGETVSTVFTSHATVDGTLTVLPSKRKSPATRKRTSKKTEEVFVGSSEAVNIQREKLEDPGLSSIISQASTEAPPLVIPKIVLASPPEGREWEDVERWVVFSDLHLSRKTEGVCMEVLKTVYAEACDRDAGILFLGDFWHARGALPVEPLNAALQEIKLWKRPSIFLTGNHDQVSVGGQVHSLEVLSAANSLVHVVDEPLLFRNALWLPYRHDPSEIERALREHPDVRAIFCHVDVVGAMVNEKFQASGGLPPSLFPLAAKVFSGHYHCPHQVGSVLYVGAPYQVTRSEAGQEKRLLVLDTNTWQILNEIRIDVGPRHFSVDSDEFPTVQKFDHLRKGDLLQWQPQRDLEIEEIKNHTEWLRQRGVHMQILHAPPSVKPRIAAAEHMDAFGLFQAYAKSMDMTEKREKMALQLLKNLTLPPQLLLRKRAEITLESVELEGYGPFLEAVTYPLVCRGVRIVSGRTSDSNGAGSNGAGKTTLLMAPLWALTGSSGVRDESLHGLSLSEMVHHDAASCRVTVKGAVNGVPFAVERTANSKRSSLKLWIDGVDKTSQDMRITQLALDDFLGDVGVLQRVAFHGSHETGRLLEASDKDFKDELSQVVSLDLWTAAKEKSLEMVREGVARAGRLEGEMTEMERQRENLIFKLEECEKSEIQWEADRGSRMEEVGKRLAALEVEIKEWMNGCVDATWQLKSGLSLFENEVNLMDSSGRGPPAEKAEEVEELQRRRESEWRTVTEVTLQFKHVKEKWDERVCQLKDFQASVKGGALCGKCRQPVSESHAEREMRQMEEMVREEERRYREQEKVFGEAKRRQLEVDKLLTEATSRQNKAMNVWKAEASTRMAEVQNYRKILQNGQILLMSAEQLLGSVNSHLPPDHKVMCLDEQTKADALECQKWSPETFLAESHLSSLATMLKSGRATLDAYKHTKAERVAWGCKENPHNSQKEVLHKLFEEVKGHMEEKEGMLVEERQFVDDMKEVDAAFGLSGVQSYILEGALAELQERVSGYLTILAGGSIDLNLTSTTKTKGGKRSVEKIKKSVVVRLEDGRVVERSMRQLSGGERRRLALSLSLGYAQFAGERSGVSCNVMVLDEVLQHLDGEGCQRAATILRNLPQTSVFVVSQAHSDLMGEFEFVDWVVKENDKSMVLTAENVNL